MRPPLTAALLLGLAWTAAWPGEQAADVPELPPVSTPLSQTPQLSLSPSIGAPAGLPDSALSAPAVPAQAPAPPPTQATPAAAEAQQPRAAAAAPPAGPSAASAAAAPPGVPPIYFVTALTKLGASPELAQRLADYQASRHPGDQSAIYHGLQHSRDVPNLTALALDKVNGLTEGQRALLIVAAALHDIDPQRAPGTPASVARTRDYLASDPDTRALLAELGGQFGFTADQVAALINATDFSPDPAARQKLQETFQDSVKKAFPDEASQQWALLWGRRLSFFDQAATYIKGPLVAEIQVHNLANELRAVAAAAGKQGPTDEQMMKGTPAFLKTLRDSPDFYLLPKVAAQNFDAVSKHFELKAQGLISPFDPAGIRSRGPPASLVAAGERALADAQQGQAALSGEQAPAAVSGARQALKAMSSKGFAFLPPGSVLSADEARQILSAADANWPTDRLFRNWSFFDGREWRVNRMQTTELVAVVQRLERRLTGLLNDAMTGEGLAPTDVTMRLGDDHPTGIHIDGSYVTATLTLRGPGTIVFDPAQDGTVRTLRAGINEAAVITNSDREYLTGVPGTVHASPPPTDPKRVVFIIRYRAARTKEVPSPNPTDAAGKARIKAVAQAVRQKPDSEAAKARGLKGIWQKLLE